MRQVTAQEKLNAVNEGVMSKKAFVQAMRREFPQFISNFDGFDSTVSILKTRKVITEKADMGKAYDEQQAATVSLDALDRGTKMELASMGCDCLNPSSISKEDYRKAYNKALANLKKNASHYIDLIAKESSSVDKNDKMKETKRGAKEVDTYNGMKKATLREVKLNIQEGTRALVGYLSGDRLTTTYNHYDGYPSNLGKGLETHYNNDEKAKEVAMKGYITYLDPETGDIESTHKDTPGKIVLPDDPEQRAMEIAEEIDKFGADYGYVWDDETNTWVTVKNTGIRSMKDQILDKLSMVNVYSEKHDREDGDGHIGTNTDDDFRREQLAQLAARTSESTVTEDEEEYLAKRDAAIKKAMEKGYTKEQVEAAIARLEEKKSNEATYGSKYGYTDDELRGDKQEGEPIVDEHEFNFFKTFFGVGSKDVYPNTNAEDEEIEAYLKSDDYQEQLKHSELDEKDIADWIDSFLEWRASTGREKAFRHDISEEANTTVSKIYEAIDKGASSNEVNKMLKALKEYQGSGEDIINIIKDKAVDSGFSEEEETQEVVEFLHDLKFDDNGNIQGVDDGLRDDPRVDKHGNEEPEDGESSFGEAKGGKYSWEHDDQGYGALEAFFDNVLHQVGTDISLEDAKKLIGSKGEGGDDTKAFDQAVITQMQNTNEDEDDVRSTQNMIQAYEEKYNEPFSTSLIKHLDDLVYEKKGKDHDGDGDVDSDDYMAAKDKAIKKAMGKNEQLKEAIKSIIKKTLLNEAHTATLQSYIDGDYDQEVQDAAKSLMDIIEKLEKEFISHKSALESAYEKAGSFLAPALEKAFMSDLSSQRASFEDVKLPKTATLSPEDLARIDQAKASGEIDELEQLEVEDAKISSEKVNV